MTQGTTAERSGPLSGETLADARRRIGSDEIHAWVSIASDANLASWDPGSGPLSGVSMGVKDIIDLVGMPTRSGSQITPGAPVRRSASLVERLVELGAVPVGKTVTTEFAYFLPGPTENPRAKGHTPGGSSSGSAAAVAAGHVQLALGSQTAGSLIRPAAYCGVAGLVLTHGAVSLDGFSGLAPSLDSAGLIAAATGGIRQVHEALFPGARPPELPRRAFLWRGGELDDVSVEMASAVESAATALRRDGVSVEPLVDGGRVARLAADHVTVMAYEAARERSDLYAERMRLSPQLRELLERGAAITLVDYRLARERTEESAAFFATLLADDSVVLGPAAVGAAPRGLASTGSPVMSRPWQLLGLPQLCVPGHYDGAGLPLGVQLIASRSGESLLLSLGEILEGSDAAP